MPALRQDGLVVRFACSACCLKFVPEFWSWVELEQACCFMPVRAAAKSMCTFGIHIMFLQSMVFECLFACVIVFPGSLRRPMVFEYLFACLLASCVILCLTPSVV